MRLLLEQELCALAAEDLQVLLRRTNKTVVEENDDDDDDDSALLLLFREAMARRSFQSFLRDDQHSKTTDDPTTTTTQFYPLAICVAHSVRAVQSVIRFCAALNRHQQPDEYRLRVCIRSGGHSWCVQSWLRGDQTILLDVGDLNSIRVSDNNSNSNDRAATDNHTGMLLSVGPGAKGDAILRAIPNHLFFPCGHCPGVPMGGFILGGGYGLGFPKYGLTSTWVHAVDVVLNNGELVTATVDSETPRDRAIFSLLRGSYTGFPGVITQYHFAALPLRPRGVWSGVALFDMHHWKAAVGVALDIQFRGDEDALEMETTVIMTHAPAAIAQTNHSVIMVAILSLTIYGNTPAEGRALWDKYTKSVKCTLIPIEEPTLVDPESIPDLASSFYPSKARYHVQAHFGNEVAYQLDDEEIFSIIEPIAEMWLSKDTRPPPAPSHTLVAPLHPTFQSKTQGDREMASGYTGSMSLQTYAIYEEPSLDSEMQNLISSAYAKVRTSQAFHTDLTAGNIPMLGAASCFTSEAYKSAQEKIALLDPLGLFACFPQQSETS